jgi:hypothetical protein
MVSPRQSNFSGLTLEEEIRSLHVLLPESVSQLPVLFAESVAKSCTGILGEGSGEALVRRIGDENLMDPDESCGRIDSFLTGGSGILKEAISRGFRMRVHRLYRMAMNLEARRLAFHGADILGQKVQLSVTRPLSTTARMARESR